MSIKLNGQFSAETEAALRKIYDFFDETLGEQSSISIRMRDNMIEINVDGEFKFTVEVKKLSIFDEGEGSYEEFKLE